MGVNQSVDVRNLEEKNKCLKELEELNTKISKLKKDLSYKDEEIQQLKNKNSKLNHFIVLFTIYYYTSSQVKRELEQEKSEFTVRLQKIFEKYKNKSQKSDSKINELQSELNRYQNILTSIFSMVNFHSNYYGQTTSNFENRHLPNQKLTCEFDISKNDRIYDHFLSLFAPEAKIRIQKIADTGEFETNRSGQFCTVNTVIFGKTLDMDARKSPQGLLLSFSKHNPARIHKNSYGQINHLSAFNYI